MGAQVSVIVSESFGGTMKLFGVAVTAGLPAVIDCTFAGNYAADSGGAIWCFFRGNPLLTNCSITGNSAGFGGGAAECIDASPMFTACVITGNAAGFEGGDWAPVEYWVSWLPDSDQDARPRAKHRYRPRLKRLRRHRQ